MLEKFKNFIMLFGDTENKWYNYYVVFILFLTVFLFLFANHSYHRERELNPAEIQSIDNLDKLFDELAPLPKTKSRGYLGMVRAGGRIADIRRSFFTELSFEEVLSHYDKEFIAKGWIPEKQYKSLPVYLGLVDEDPSMYSSKTYIKGEKGEYSAHITYNDAKEQKVFYFIIYYSR